MFYSKKKKKYVEQLQATQTAPRSAQTAPLNSNQSRTQRTAPWTDTNRADCAVARQAARITPGQLTCIKKKKNSLHQHSFSLTRFLPLPNQTQNLIPTIPNPILALIHLQTQLYLTLYIHFSIYTHPHLITNPKNFQNLSSFITFKFKGKIQGREIRIVAKELLCKITSTIRVGKFQISLII